MSEDRYVQEITFQDARKFFEKRGDVYGFVRNREMGEFPESMINNTMIYVLVTRFALGIMFRPITEKEFENLKGAIEIEED